MTDPVIFASTSPRFGLPLLFAGQAQKEFTINEGIALTDALLHLAVEGEALSPPVAPAEGDCWLIHPSASGDWVGYGRQCARRTRPSRRWRWGVSASNRPRRVRPAG